MMTPFPPKTPTQMRREAEQRGKPARRAVKPGPVDPAAYPPLAAEFRASMRRRPTGLLTSPRDAFKSGEFRNPRKPATSTILSTSP